LIAAIFQPALFGATLRIATPVILAAMGGVISERSGVINIGLEGMMLLGAFGAVVGSYYTGACGGLIIGVLVGGLLGLLHAFFSVTVRANQIISAVGINILAASLPNVLIPIIWEGYNSMTPSVAVIPDIRIPILADVPVLGKILGYQNPVVYLALLIVFAMHFFLFKTPLGLRIRSVGEQPRAADTLGINVFRLRYFAVTLSGSLAGLGGAFLAIGYQSMFSQQMTQGRGFIGLAAMIFGRWYPIGACIACLIFGFADALQAAAQAAGVPVPPQILLSLPYVLTLVALVGVIGKRTIPPAADGKPYRKEMA
jgi:ABC-type uncharacterized transport system permease subunit